MANDIEREEDHIDNFDNEVDYEDSPWILMNSFLSTV